MCSRAGPLARAKKDPAGKSFGGVGTGVATASGYAKATAAGSWLRSRERQAGRAARLEEPLQEHRREDAKQHGDHERQPAGHGPLPLTLTLLWIGFRAFALMPLHTPMVSRSSVRDKRVE